MNEVTSQHGWMSTADVRNLRVSVGDRGGKGGGNARSEMLHAWLQLGWREANNRTIYPCMHNHK